MDKDDIIKETLSYVLGAKLHEAWCEEELHAFFLRAQEHAKTQNPGEAIRKACYKGEDKRNEVEIDAAWLSAHGALASECLTDFETFKKVVSGGGIDVKRFTKRSLTKEEIERAGSNYVDGKENILRPFHELSSASQKDNLEAARVAVALVYDKAMNSEIITPEELEQMGSIIHEEWLKRNPWVYDPVYGNPKQALPYDKLDDSEKDKDKAHIRPAVMIVQEYANGLIDINEVRNQYGLSPIRIK
jgi:hypothetical protein